MSEKKEYRVDLPVTGSVSVFVEAEDKESAIDTALQTVDFQVDSCNENTEPGDEWRCHRHVTEGNMTHAVLNDVFVEEDE